MFHDNINQLIFMTRHGNINHIGHVVSACVHTFSIFLALLTKTLKRKLPAWSSKQWKQCWCDRSSPHHPTHPLKFTPSTPCTRNLTATIMMTDFRLSLSLLALLSGLFFDCIFHVCVWELPGVVSALYLHSLSLGPHFQVASSFHLHFPPLSPPSHPPGTADSSLPGLRLL